MFDGVAMIIELGGGGGAMGVGMYDDNQLMLQPSQTFGTGSKISLFWHFET